MEGDVTEQRTSFLPGHLSLIVPLWEATKGDSVAFVIAVTLVRNQEIAR